MAKSSFDASASALGYVFQIRFALLMALRRVRAQPDIQISLETLDDVAFDSEGSPQELFQTKHHVKSEADLTDYSGDLWKALRVWSTSKQSGNLKGDARLFLVTTAMAADRSVASYLRESKRDVDSALKTLEQVARTSQSESNKKAYEVFLSLKEAERKELLHQVFVVDRFADIETAKSLIEEDLALVVDRDMLTSFVQRLEGWWMSRSIRYMLAPHPRPSILGQEIEAKISDLREQFRSDSLPIDPDIVGASVDTSVYEDRTFVKQLRLVELGRDRVRHAILDFYRAFEQRGRWLREELLYVDELSRYEKGLEEEWDRRFARMKERLGSNAAEKTRKKEGRELYNWAEETLFHIRPGCTQPFVCRGSFQMLSDKESIGWHVDFKERLKVVLGAMDAAA